MYKRGGLTYLPDWVQLSMENISRLVPGRHVIAKNILQPVQYDEEEEGKGSDSCDSGISRFSCGLGAARCHKTEFSRSHTTDEEN
jgi:hypothetical protein